MYEMLQKILEVAEFKRTEYDTVVANFKKLRESGYKKREPNLSEMINASIQSIAIDHKLKGVLYGGNYMNLYFRKMAKFPEERWFLDVKNAIEKAGGGLTISHENKGIIRRWVYKCPD